VIQLRRDELTRGLVTLSATKVSRLRSKSCPERRRGRLFRNPSLGESESLRARRFADLTLVAVNDRSKWFQITQISETMNHAVAFR
jgi:hypothetical protein